MFEVFDREKCCVYTVFDVTYDVDGNPLFLVFDENIGGWVRKDATNFIPCSTD